MNKSNFNPMDHIGEQHGIYTIVDVIENDVSNRKVKFLYKAICQVCGFERIAPYSDINSRETKKCTHVKRVYEKKNCLYCGKEIPIGKSSVQNYNKKQFCNSSCAASYNNKYRKQQKYCLNCGKEIPPQNTYCSNRCHLDHQQIEWERRWFAGEVSGNSNPVWTDISNHVRTYLFKKYNNKCAKCGWGEVNPYTGTIPLEVEHIDGNPYNTTPQNVILLCPNCHSLTSTYRGANKGNGRGKLWLPPPIDINR